MLEEAGADANRSDGQGLLFPVWEFGSVSEHLSAPTESKRDVLMGGTSNGDLCPANRHKPIKTCHR